MRREPRPPLSTTRPGANHRHLNGSQSSARGRFDMSAVPHQAMTNVSHNPSFVGRLSREQSHWYNTPRQETLPRDEDLQFDAFDLELLAQSDQCSRIRQAPFPTINGPSVCTTRAQSDTSSKLVSRFFREDSHTTPHQSLASSSSDVGLTSPLSPLARFQVERMGQMVEQSSGANRSHEDVASIVPARTEKVPFQNIPMSVRGIVLVSVHELPDKYRSLFHFPVFNAVQSKCFHHVYKTDDNIVLAAPTGSGKTVIMELAICRLLNNLKDERFKVVYQAPTKSLCAERFQDWNRKFYSLGIHCAELTGDTDYTQLKAVQNSQVIITTPEKWDSMTRKWKDHARLMQLVKLFLIDEVHILKETRGATLEAVVSRMKSIGSNVRFIALSATIPNSEDIATWIGKDPTNQHVPAHREHFGEEFRPVKLQRFVYGYQSHGNDFAFDKMCNSKLPHIIATHSCRKPMMIFCCTRNSSVATAKELARLWSMSNPPMRLWKGPTKRIEVNNADLKTTTVTGVAFHHAGLDPSDRHTVETEFLQNQLSIICCTSTLAVGVNLPCHLVVIKNTVGWHDGSCKEYSDLEIMQMLGRAGRPQFDDSATAVILTRKERVENYERLISGSESLESCLHLHLIDHLNAEIGLGNVTNIESAIRWLSGTFLFVRIRRNPTHYQLKENASKDDEDEMLRQICEKDIKLLQECGLVSTGCLKSTQFGDAMARYYVRFETMKVFLKLEHHATVHQILDLLTQADEFREVRLKAGEKSLYKEINLNNSIWFPVKVDIALPSHKVSLIIQSELSALDFPDGDQFQKHKFPFQQDKSFVFTHVNRLIRCIIDCQISLEDSIATRNALELARSFGAKVWDSSPFQMKQIEQIGVVAVRKLAAAGINSIEALESTEPHRIDMILSKNPPFGLKLLGRLSEFPKLRVSIKLARKETKPLTTVKIYFKAEIAFINDKCPAFFKKHPVRVCFLAETSDGRLVDFRRLSANKVRSTQEILLHADITDPDQYIVCYAMCDEIAGTLKSAELRPDLPKPLRFTQSWHESDKKAREHVMNSSRPCSNNSVQIRPEADSNRDSFGSDDSIFDDILIADDTGDWEVANIQKSPSRRNSSLTRSTKPSKPAKQTKNVLTTEEPSRLKNGRWRCNHKCKDKTICKHLCCREGLEKPPKLGRKHSVTENYRSDTLSQLTLSASITKNDTQPAILTKAKKRGDSTPCAISQQLPQEHQAWDVDWDDDILAEANSNHAVITIKDDSSDYEDDSLNDLPSPSVLILGRGTDMTSDKLWPALPTSFTKTGRDGENTTIPIQDAKDIKHTFTSSVNDMKDSISAEPGIEVSTCGLVSGDRRKRCLTPEMEHYNKREMKKYKGNRTTDDFVSQSSFTVAKLSSASSQNLHSVHTATPPAIPADWDDIDPVLLDEFKDIVNFF
ncbi:Sec63 Brl domain-containing protein [Aspergillus avenaceus]|uniref:DNA 3'-5' helicase n=1 Tax=Aspergillus avenaceus TaxID=36643 RepID=A0A5N6TPG2_ASPAV|nr:Sec63 Brl domain-containing protein [Aspergillus avenaceus]